MVCQALSMAMTVVLPAPVASLSANRMTPALAVSGVTPQSLGLGVERHLSTSARTRLMMAEWYCCSSVETSLPMSNSACLSLALRFWVLGTFLAPSHLRLCIPKPRAQSCG